MKKIFIETTGNLTWTEVSAEITLQFVEAVKAIQNHGILPLVASFPWVCGLYDRFCGYKIETCETWHDGNVHLCLTK